MRVTRSRKTSLSERRNEKDESSDSSSDSETEIDMKDLVTKSLQDLERMSDSESDSDSDMSDDEEPKPKAKISTRSKSDVAPEGMSTIFIDRGHGRTEVLYEDGDRIEKGESSSDEDIEVLAPVKKKTNQGQGRELGEGDDTDEEIGLASSLDTGSDLSSGIYINVDAYRKPCTSGLNLPKAEKHQHAVMKKSVMDSGFEKKQVIPTYQESVRQVKKQRRIERSKSKGAGWFDMPIQEMTEEKKNELTVLRMRNVLDNKRFYKGFDTVALPKFFQRGRVVEGAAEFYSSRIPKKQRKANLVDELLADSDFRKKNKEKCMEIHNKRRRFGKLKRKK